MELLSTIPASQLVLLGLSALALVSLLSISFTEIPLPQTPSASTPNPGHDFSQLLGETLRFVPTSTPQACSIALRGAVYFDDTDNQLCQCDGSDWRTIQDNSECSGNSAACLDDCAVPEATQCNGQTVEKCGNFDSDSCLEWGYVTACTAGQVCQNGTCTTGTVCTPHASKSCYSGNVYWYDSCGTREERFETCNSDETCQGGQCISTGPTCTPHTYQQCYNNDVYWYNSCDERDGRAQDCPQEVCEDDSASTALCVCATDRLLNPDLARSYNTNPVLHPNQIGFTYSFGSSDVSNIVRGATRIEIHWNNGTTQNEYIDPAQATTTPATRWLPCRGGGYSTARIVTYSQPGPPNCPLAFTDSFPDNGSC